jgi:hypothetical protein
MTTTKTRPKVDSTDPALREDGLRTQTMIDRDSGTMMDREVASDQPAGITGAHLYSRLQKRDRTPAWAVPAAIAGVVVIAGALVLTSGRHITYGPTTTTSSATRTASIGPVKLKGGRCCEGIYFPVASDACEMAAS